jgi:hypothetical protein
MNNFQSITSSENREDVVHRNNYFVFDYHNQQVYQMVIENLGILSHLFNKKTMISLLAISRTILNDAIV